MATIKGIGALPEHGSRAGTTDREALLEALIEGPVERVRADADAFWKRIRRELLRHHRRLVVHAASTESDRPFDSIVRLERAELAEWWRTAIQERVVSSLSAPRWHPDAWLSLRGLSPGDAEAVSATFAIADLAVADRMRALHETLTGTHVTLVKSAKTDDMKTLEARLGALREEMDGQITRAATATPEHVQRIVARASEVLAGAAVAAAEAPDPEDPRSERADKQRLEGLAKLGEAVRRSADWVAAEHQVVALRLELATLEARFGEALDSRLAERVQDVRGRLPLQLARVQSAIADALTVIGTELGRDVSPGDLISGLEMAIDPVQRVVEAAERSATQLAAEMSDDRAIAPLLDGLAKAVQPLTDRYVVPATRNREASADKLPEGKLVTLPFREILGAHVEASVGPRLAEAARATGARARAIATTLGELGRGLRVNLRIATGELAVLRSPGAAGSVPPGRRERTDSDIGALAPIVPPPIARPGVIPPETLELVRQVLVGFLERSRDAFVRHAQDAAAHPDTFAREAREAVMGGLPALGDQLLRGQVAQLRADQVRLQIAEAAYQLPGVLSRGWVRLRAAAATLLGERRLAAWTDALGLPSGAPEGIDRASLQPPPEPAHLPLAYRRVFAARAIDAGDLTVGQGDTLDRARRALAGESGPARSVALIGPDGAGKNGLAAAAMRSRPWGVVHRLDGTAPIDVAAVDALFDRLGTDELVSVQGLHWLIAMRPGGFAPLRRLVERIADDRGRNAFVIRADDLVWRYASEIAPLGQAFGEVIDVGALSPAALEAAVLARHTLTGFGASFGEEAKPESRLDELVSRGVGYLGGPRAGYFRELHAASGGLLRDALRLWLASIQHIDEKDHVVRLGAVPPSPIEAVRRLHPDVIAALYTVARQGWMDADVLSWVRRTSRVDAAARLAQLARLGVLNPLDAVYRITPHLRGPVHAVLHERGWT